MVKELTDEQIQDLADLLIGRMNIYSMSEMLFGAKVPKDEQELLFERVEKAGAFKCQECENWVNKSECAAEEGEEQENPEC